MDISKFLIKQVKSFFTIHDSSDPDDYESIEMFFHPKKSDMEASATSALSGPTNVESILDYFKSMDLKHFIEHSTKVLLFKLQVNDPTNKPVLLELDEISNICFKKSVVLLISTKFDETLFLYWKPKNVKQFWELKLDADMQNADKKKLVDFMIPLLAHIMKNGHTGVHSKTIIQQNYNIFELKQIVDHRNFNLLLIAAEQGDSFIVKLMLDMNLSTKSSNTNAQSLAWKGRHYEVILLLLQYNQPYPTAININECPENIKNFYEINRGINEAILSGDSSKVEEIISLNPNIVHFYNLRNESALVFALRNKLFDMYELLMSNEIKFGPHEKFSSLEKSMNENERTTVRKIHYKQSKFLPENHLHILLANSRFGPGPATAERRYLAIQQTFDVLNKSPFTQTILMIVAASRNFSIFFDFNCDSSAVFDPLKNKKKTKNQININAQYLLDSSTKDEGIGVVAAELCRYALNLVYKNNKPYSSDDRQAETELNELSRIYMELSAQEDIFDYIYKLCPPQLHHFELIARLPQVILTYSNNPLKLENFCRNFAELLNFYETRVINKMKDALPEIEVRKEMESEKKSKKSIIIISIIYLLAFVTIVVLISVLLLVFYEPTYKFSELSDADKVSVVRAPIIYKNVTLEFGELFAANSTIYAHLTSEHILQMLKGIPLDFEDPHLYYIDVSVKLQWTSIPKKLKKKFLDTKFDFQNESITFMEIYKYSPAIFAYLTSQQIEDVLNKKELIVHSMIKNETKFYIPRKFMDADIYEIYYAYMQYIDNDEKYNRCLFFNTRKIVESFESFYREFKTKKDDSHIKQIKNDKTYKECSLSDFKVMNPQDDDTLLSHKSFHLNTDQIISEAFNSKIFILSAQGGTGKTVVFEQLTMEIKKKYPHLWVSFIDLKDHKEFYRNTKPLTDIENMLEVILQLSPDNEFELNFFRDYFDLGNVVLLWNGFDEISPYFSENVIKIIGLIRNETNNVQFVSTRPYYSDILRDNL